MSTAQTDAAVQVGFTDGLRRLADLLDEHEAAVSYDAYRHLIVCGSREEMMAIVRKFGGRWEKDSGGKWFRLTRDLGGGVGLHVYAARSNVCEKVVVGTRKVQRPAPDAPMVEVEEEVVEWRCPPSILAVAQGDES